MSDQNNDESQGSDSNAGILYAGKFKTVADLEEGYKNSAVVFDENKTLKKQLEEVSKIPDSYLNPGDIEIDTNRVADIQARAREAGMTQAQYEKFLRSDKARLDKNKEHFESSRKEIGEETLNLLNDYVSKHYPKELQDNMLKTFISNKEARQAALNHRTQLLNNRVPGIDKTSALGAYRVSDEDIKKAYAAKEKNKGDMRARQTYINLINARAEQERAS